MSAIKDRKETAFGILSCLVIGKPVPFYDDPKNIEAVVKQSLAITDEFLKQTQ